LFTQLLCFHHLRAVMHFDLLTCFHALLKDLNYELLHTFAQHDKAKNVPHSSILPLTRRIDGEVTISTAKSIQT